MAKILVIDDDPMIVDIILDCLIEAGHVVSSATDAYTGMNLAMRERPDLITLDFEMPAGDGGRVHERLRGNLNTARIPIVFVTGVEASKLPPFARGDAATRFVPKPIILDDLRAAVAELLGQPPPVKKEPEKPARAETRLDGGALGGDILDLDL
ncbi:MAG TPA: response regulator [Elusimicrobiota bacterium]|jgi:CheY-like chemotaxis protein|nr:response regulator [Elusimicrobiota bacterium]